MAPRPSTASTGRFGRRHLRARGLRSLDHSMAGANVTNEFKRNNQRRWTTLWDRPNRRVLILGAPESTEMWWDFVVVDDSASIPDVYTIWRGKQDGALVAAEIRLGPDDDPLGFPDHLISSNVLGSPTIWPYPSLESFMWWRSPAESKSSSEEPHIPEASENSETRLASRRNKLTTGVVVVSLTSDREPTLERAFDWMQDIALSPGRLGTDYWPGDYRELILECPIDGGRKVLLKAHAEASHPEIAVNVTFEGSDGADITTLEAQANQLLEAMQSRPRQESHDQRFLHADLTLGGYYWIGCYLDGLRRAFSLSGTLNIDYTQAEGTRLNDMAVFEGIRPHELLNILDASDFKASLSWSEAAPVISVEGTIPFTVGFCEPAGRNFLSVILAARFEGPVTLKAVNALNAILPTGAAHRTDGLDLELRLPLAVTGGVSHAAVRDRLDEWIKALSIAAATQVSN